MTLAEMVRDGGIKAWDVARVMGEDHGDVSYSYIAGYWCAHHNKDWRPYSLSQERLDAWRMGYDDAKGDMECE